MVPQAVRVSADPLAAQENQAVSDHLVSLATRVKLVVMASLDQEESKETQVCDVICRRTAVPTMPLSELYLLRE